MSNNTNSLFWVITGAVIIFSIFTLTSFTTNKSISDINNSFSEYAGDIIDSKKSYLKKYYNHESDYENLSVESEDLFIFDEETQSISGYTGKNNIIVFPANINGKEVKSIGNLGLNINYNYSKSCPNLKKLYENNPDNSLYERRYNDLVKRKIIQNGECTERTLPIRIVIPNTVTEIQKDFITSLQTMKEIKFPSSLEVLQANAITNSSIEKIDFGKNTNLKKIGWCALCGNKITGTVYIPESVEYMDTMVFQNNDIEHVIFKANIENMPYNTFTGNKNLKDIKIYSTNLMFPNPSQERDVVFDENVWKKIKVYIPKGSLNFYQNQLATNFYNLEEFDE